MNKLIDKRVALFIILITILIINFIIFIPKFIWGDEAWSANISSMGLIESIKNSLNDFHPPLYHIFLSLILYVLPDSTILLRLTSTIFGILTIYVILFKLNIYIGDSESYYISIILTFSPFFLYIFSLVRMYPLAIFLSSLSLYLFFHVNLVSDTKLTYFSTYVISNLLMMLTHYLTIPLFFLEGLYFLIKKNFKGFKYFIITAILYLPFSYFFLIQLKRRLSLTRGWGNILPETFFSDFFTYLFLNTKNISIFIILIFLILILFGFLKIKKKTQKFFILFFISYFFMYYLIVKLFGSLYHHYISLAILPSYFLLTKGILFFEKYKEKILIFIIIILFSFFPMTFIKAYPEILDLQNEIKGKKVIFLNRYEMYRFTFGIEGEFEYLMDLPLNNFTLDKDEKLKFVIDYLENEKKPFILIYSGVGSNLLSIYDPKGKLKKYLEENAHLETLYGIYSESPVYLYNFIE
ncbi:MAG: hypothetical protein ACUVQN_01620 [Caldisericia bacterium]